MSYKDICLGVNGHNVSEEDGELFELDAQLDEHAASSSDKDGKCMGLRYFHDHFLKLWRPKGSMEVTDIDDEYFVIRFEDLADLQHLLDDGPWMLADHYIVIQRWQPSFFPLEDDLRRVAVWVRIPGLPIEFYDRRVLRRIEGRVYPVEYEGLHMDRNGDKDQQVNEPVQTPQQMVEDGPVKSAQHPMQVVQDPVTTETFGPWMIAQKSHKRNSRNPSGNSGLKVGDSSFGGGIGGKSGKKDMQS
ncbi:hypothetical protein SESBI_33832 [Sesbania bispinosa]|nr:hypothetical protein SESBI_33832 [Sesbania bispinosa]